MLRCYGETALAICTEFHFVLILLTVRRAGVDTQSLLFMTSITHHVDGALWLEDASSQQHGKEQFVFLKETSTDIAVQAVREIVVYVAATISYVICT